MWQLKIPNVDKHFLWRACHGIFPTKVKLCERKMLSDPICPVYEREPETIFYTLWQCPATGDVWSGGGTIFQKSCYKGPDFLQVVEGMLSKCDKKKKKSFFPVRKYNTTNLAMTELFYPWGSFSHPNSIIQQTAKAIEEFSSIVVGKKIKRQAAGDSSLNRWKAPPLGWFKANWDAGVDRKKERVGLGVIII